MLTPAPTTAPVVRRAGRIRDYARLGKLDVYDYYLSVLVTLSAAIPVAGFGGRQAATVLLFLLGEVLFMVAQVALDDYTGYLDGSDIRNYGPDNPLRRKERKPLVAGALSPAQALRFAWVSAAAGAALWVLALLTAPHLPVWTVVLMVATYVVGLQYSYGLKISYHGCQEIYLVLLGAALVLAPLGLSTGQYSDFWLLQGILFGFGPLMFGVYSNTNDVEGDRAVNRPTVAALTSPRGNAVFIGALSLAEFALGAVASATGLAPWWFVLLMLPATVQRLRQYLTGFVAGDIMRARGIGFTVHRVSTALLVAANLLAAWSLA
ncbi:UbiA family prenyltransferase [Actinophytocola sp.]|uniref:UbiA family prenyltransferase n=1 Tax=Actinophytocola sp. TaxID=1872138 RepID=UPI00389AC730